MFNANNYGYNPYGRYQQPMPQPMQQVIPQNSLNGKIVDSIDVVKSMDIPLDGSISYFPTADGSAIVSKQLMNDGTSKITIFKPFTKENDEVKYITSKDLEKALDELNLSKYEDIEDTIKDIKKELKDLKKKKEE